MHGPCQALLPARNVGRVSSRCAGWLGECLDVVDVIPPRVLIDNGSGSGNDQSRRCSDGMGGPGGRSDDMVAESQATVGQGLAAGQAAADQSYDFRRLRKLGVMQIVACLILVRSTTVIPFAANSSL